MAKKAIIFHGTSETPDSFWHPWLAEQLRKRGYEVAIPAYPDINKIPLAEFLPKVLQNEHIDSETVLVGHSAGAPLILSILERIEVVIPLAVLVAGYASPLPVGKDPILQDEYNWDRIKTHAKDFVFFNSTNDPWGCNDKQGRAMLDQLGGTLIIRNDGHFGSTAKNQPYKTFELLDRIIP